MTDANAVYRYLGGIARREGAFVIIPKNGAVKGLPENLREVPCTVLTPDGRTPGEFAERGNRGSWLLMWCPPDLRSRGFYYAPDRDTGQPRLFLRHHIG